MASGVFVTKRTIKAYDGEQGKAPNRRRYVALVDAKPPAHESMALANGPLFVEDGYLEMIRVWSKELAEHLEQGLPMRESTICHLAGVLHAIGAGESAEVAFGLKRTQGGRPKRFADIQKNNRIAERVFELQSLGFPLKTSRSKTGAMMTVAEEFHVQLDRVELAWKLCGQKVKSEHWWKTRGENLP